MEKPSLFCLLALLSVGAQAGYYKCVDPNGQLRYSDKICSATGSEEVPRPRKPPEEEDGDTLIEQGQGVGLGHGYTMPGDGEAPVQAVDESGAAPAPPPAKPAALGGIVEKIRSWFSSLKAPPSAQPAPAETAAPPAAAGKGEGTPAPAPAQPAAAMAETPSAPPSLSPPPQTPEAKAEAAPSAQPAPAEAAAPPPAAAGKGVLAPAPVDPAALDGIMVKIPLLVLTPGAPPVEGEGRSPGAAPSAYTCQGKTRCEEMSSCEEAAYYLAHCPGPALDEDGDGVPCEEQVCK